MNLRSLLFVPGDRPDRMLKALGSGADALILDLEDAVAPSHKAEARVNIASYLTTVPRQGIHIFVRINSLGSEFIDADLDMISQCVCNGVVLPKAEGSASVLALLSLAPDLPPILPITSETPAAIFALGSFANCAAKLAALTWGGEDLTASIGAADSRDEQGNLFPAIEMARSLTLYGAHAAGVTPIETVYPDFRDLDGLAITAKQASRHGFGGMLAIHPSQVAIINDAFRPSDSAIEEAHAIVMAFQEVGESGVLQINGKMRDAPHLKRAKRLLENLT